MNTEQTWQISAENLEATLQIAASIGAKLQGGEVIELCSDLGGGKTAFVRGLAAGMGSTDQVSSPSFTLSNVYKTLSLTLYHFDFYRLEQPGIMQQELAEVMNDPRAVVAVEWADIVSGVLTPRKLKVVIKASGEQGRDFTLTFDNSLAYLLEDLKH